MLNKSILFLNNSILKKTCKIVRKNNTYKGHYFEISNYPFLVDLQVKFVNFSSFYVLFNLCVIINKTLRQAVWTASNEKQQPEKCGVYQIKKKQTKISETERLSSWSLNYNTCTETKLLNLI